MLAGAATDFPLMATHITFEPADAPSTAKTKRWNVIAKDGNIPLGQIRWFAQWYQYSFYPAPDTIFEKTCLRDIADFCETESRAHRKGWQVKVE